MGCDIHAFVERREDYNGYTGRHTWWPIANDSFYVGRNYAMFGLLADVRGDGCLYPARGIPDDVSYRVQEKSVEWGSDAHTHSYLTFDELLEVMQAYRERFGDHSVYADSLGVGWECILAVMDALDELGVQSRIVFWFDN